MKCCFGIIILLSCVIHAVGQQSPVIPKTPMASRQVTGIVLDSVGNPVANANLKLISEKDSILTAADKEGIFVIEHVRSAVFLLTVSEVGYKTTTLKYFNNNQTSKIVLDPIVLRDESYQLKQVTITGKPTITYKTDTVEYRAGDYKVKEYDNVDELLKKMGGMEVGADGSLAHNGQQVTKAKLNGREFGGGNVANAIQNLPANIVDKIQIVDDYGDQAVRTGIKTGPPTKTLNITTRADRSIGNLATITSQEGNNNRYNERLSLQNIYANRTISLTGNITNTVNGIANNNSTTAPLSINGTEGSSVFAPGSTKSGMPAFSYTNSWDNRVTLTASYTLNFNNTSALTDNYGETNSNRGASIFRNNSTGLSITRAHTAKLQVDYNIGKLDYLQINPSFSYNTSNQSGEKLTSNLNYFTTGFEHPVVAMTAHNPASTSSHGLTALYVHTFKKPKRNFSVQVGLTRVSKSVSGDKRADYRYYSDTSLNFLISDSLSHLQTFKTSNTKVYRSVITYVEPINTRSQMEFTSQIRSSVYDNKAISDTVLENGRVKQLNRLDNIYNYTFKETRLTANYRYDGKKHNLSVGAALVPSVLAGAKVDNNTSDLAATSRSFFRIIPILRYAYAWSSVERLEVSYSGTSNEPDFQQLQPFTDRSDPNNVIIGNPDLKPTFIHNVTSTYNKYFPNNKLTIAINLNGIWYDNQVATNIVQVTEPISPASNKTINEINYVNVDGNKTVTANHSISKQLKDHSYDITLNGSFTYGYINALSNNQPYHTNYWNFSERFGPQISLNDNQIQINPYIGFETTNSATNTPGAKHSTINTFRLAVEGGFFLKKNFQFHYKAGKNYLSGITNYNLNPLVINTGIEKRLLRAHNLAITADVFDLLHQNNFIQQYVTPQSTIYTLSNTLSRYFMLGVKLNLQKWGGTPTRNGKPMKRRGDGSFIN